MFVYNFGAFIFLVGNFSVSEGASQNNLRGARCYTRAIPEVQGDEINFDILGVKNVVDFRWQIFCRFSPGKMGLNIVTENFATFCTSLPKRWVLHRGHPIVVASRPGVTRVIPWFLHAPSSGFFKPLTLRLASV